MVWTSKDGPKCPVSREDRGEFMKPQAAPGPLLPEKRAHKVMTPEEYAAMPIIGWHEVCRDVDGFGGVGIRYLGTSPVSRPDRESPKPAADMRQIFSDGDNTHRFPRGK